MESRTSSTPLPRPANAFYLVGAGLSLLWAYWPTAIALVQRWSSDSRYAHGFLVPLFALALYFVRRPGREPANRGLTRWGVAAVAFGCLLRILGAMVYNDWLDAVSLLPVIAGLVLLWGGPAALQRAWPAIAFLAFMVPLPYRVEAACSVQLRHAASRASAYALRVLGLPALADGQTVELIESGSRLEVGDECSGLSMLFSLVAVSTAVALIIPRRLSDRLIIVASAVPIAWVVNVSRITSTGILHDRLGGRLSDSAIHDLAGWCAVPLAIGLLYAEVILLSRLFIAEPVRHWTAATRSPADAGNAPGDSRERQVAPTTVNLAGGLAQSAGS